MRTFLRVLLKAWLRLRVQGDLAALSAPRALVLAAHGSILDGLVLAAVLPPHATLVLGTDDWSSRVVRWVARHLRHAVVELSEPSAVKRLTRLLSSETLVAMFPEGRVQVTGGMMRLYESVAAAAVRSGALLIPVSIIGLRESALGRTPGRYSRLWRPRVTVTIHAPQALPAFEKQSARRRRHDATQALAAMLQRAAVDARPRRTLLAALIDTATRYGRRTPMLEDVKGHPQRLGDLLTTSLAFARIASKLAPAGESVGILMPNMGVTVGMIFGLSAVGRTPALLNYTAGPEAVSGACAAAAVRVVITSRQFIEASRLYLLLDALHHQTIVFVEDLRSGFAWHDKLWLKTIGRLWPRTVITERNPHAPAVILFTSGSEGHAKGVALSHDAILANIAQMRAVFDFSPADRFLNALPMFHSYGLTACTLMPILSGTPLYLYTTPLRYRVIPEIVYRRDCTVLFGTSTFLAHYGQEADAYDFARLRVVISGGEKLDSEVALLWLKKFSLRIYEGYGATECAPVVALNTPLAYCPDTVGRFLPGIEWRLESVDGITRGGRLHIRGPNLMLGYLQADAPGEIVPPQSTQGVGWHDTGDVVEVDRDGNVVVLGRVRRFAKIAGEMVALDLVERVALHASPRAQHAATVAILPGSGESTLLFTTDPLLNRGLLHRSARLLGSQDLAVARRIVHVEALPLLGSGKTDYVKLQDLAERTPLALVTSNTDLEQ